MVKRHELIPLIINKIEFKSLFFIYIYKDKCQITRLL